VATLTGRTARSTLPSCDTPGVNLMNPGSPDGLSRTAAEAAWRAVTAAIAGTPHVRVSRDGGRTYPARHARPLPEAPPGQPCTVPVFDPGTGTGRMLALDLDPGRAGRDVDDATFRHDHERRAGPVAEVGIQAEGLARLVARCGGQALADVSPSGGRHVYVLFATPLPWRELRDVARALALRFPAVDPAPMASLGGQISPPGSRHKSGGWRVLSMPPGEARAAVEHPNGSEVWNALLTEFAAELQQTALTRRDAESGLSAELDDTGAPWVPRLGGRASLGAELEHIARTGRWDRSRYQGRSEARMAVLGVAASRGWRLTEVESAVACGAWKGLAALYERRSEPGRLDRLLPYEWQKCVAKISGEKNVRHWHTSDLSTRPPAGETSSSAEYGLIRQWLTAILCAAEDPERVKGWGRRAVAVRLVLLALGQAAMVSGSSVVEFGTRNLALHSALSHRTVSRVLQILRDEPDPLIDLVSVGRMARADRYALRIPDRYAASVRWRRRRAGCIEAAHPAFLMLGGTVALVYEALGPEPARGAEVARGARLSASTVSVALRVLAEHGLAERGPGGWRRGPADLDDVAESTGAADLHREREERYRQDRESWRARLRQYQGARARPVNERDGWWSLDDPDEYDFMACRWPVLSDDFVRGPPPAAAREIA
jgi:DNA-binding transcriptional ArsR family regulator